MLNHMSRNDQIEDIFYFSASGGRNYTGQSSIVAYYTIDDIYGSDAPAFASQVQAAPPSYTATIAAANNNATSAENILELLQIQHSLLFDAHVPTVENLLAASGQNLSCELWGTMPFARDSVHIQSNSPSARPLIDLRYWMFPYETSLQIRAARFVRNLFLATSPLKDIVLFEGYPGFATVPEDASDAVWEEWLKKHMRSAHHPIGTAIVLPREKGGVTGPRCGVHGTRNVRVVDASLIPLQTNGHTSSTVYAVTERCADLIKQDLGLS